MTAARRDVERMASTIAADIVALENSTIRALLPSLLAARDELRRGLAEWLARADGAERFTAQQFRRGLASIEAALAAIAQVRPEMQRELDAATGAGAGLAADHIREELARFSGHFGETLRPTQISTAAIAAHARHEIIPRIRTSSSRYVQAVREDMRHQLAIGLAAGETFEQLTNRLRRLGGPRGLVALRGIVGEPGAHVEEIAEGLFNRYRHWAERVVRTEVINAYNVEHAAGLELLNDDLEEDEEPFVQRWDSTPDKRRCLLCAALDGKTAPIGGKFPGTDVKHPPLHPQCRCVTIAWHPSWGGLPGELGAQPAKPAKPKNEREPKPESPKPEAPKPEAPKLADAIRALREPAAVGKAGAPMLEDLRDGDYRAASRKLDSYLDKHFVSSADPNRGDVEVTTHGMQALTHSGDKVTARAYRTWDGAIRLSPGVAKEIESFAAEVGVGQQAGDLVKALEERASAITEHRRKLARKLGKKWQAVKDTVPTGSDEFQRIGKITQSANGVRTFVHEHLHGFSPINASAYRGAAGQIEELTTEITARAVGRDLLGLPMPTYNEGSYKYDIRAGTEAIAELTGKSIEDSYSLLQRASAAFKQRTARLDTERAAVDAFVADLADVTKQPAGHVGAVLQRRLEQAAKHTREASGG